MLYLQANVGEWSSSPLSRSSDGGHQWEAVEDQGWTLALGAASGELYRASAEGVLVSKDHGGHWTSTGVPDGSVFVGTSPLRPGMLYAVTTQWNAEGPIYVSADTGRTWSEESGWVPGGSPTVSVGAGAGERVYLVGDAWSMSRSDDGGESWRRCADIGYAAHYGSPLTIDPRDDDRLYLGTRSTGVMVSTDGCRSWSPSSSGLSSLFVNAIAVDPNQPDTLYAGTDGGAFVSFDGGATWGEINEGLLGATVVYSVVVDPESNVYAATPYGIFRLEAR
jgi:photosystem II stability/assembly factor-like uncharacterized protein